ncbi:hypothetical protein [Stutzerimonas xanthomarina]|uniref:hypothetical protein n=1 Tax=Stutzerimonas xanthomarina TaxID=271420 RepID=UPI003AA8FF60
MLPLCLGSDQVSQYLLDADKGYEPLPSLASRQLRPMRGEVIERKDVTVQAQLESLLPQVRGDRSRCRRCARRSRRDGQPLYKLARAGEVVEREPRSVTIARLDCCRSKRTGRVWLSPVPRAPISGPWSKT